MSPSGGDVWVYVEHLRGAVAGHTYELLGKGREVADTLGCRLVGVLLGSGVRPLATGLGVADRVICLEDSALAEFTPQAHAHVLRALAQSEPPRLILFGATSVGMDLATLLASTLGMPLVVNCKAIDVEDGRVVATSQLCGGKLLCESAFDGPGVLTVLPGAFPGSMGMSERTPMVESLPLPVGALLESLNMKALRLLEPEPGDVDITRAPALVAVGRGIQRKENLPMAEELADLLGGAVCASRPVIDQGWLPLSRQVGKSGMIVKPKLYVALGISGASEHVEGMKDSELIIAVNTDPMAPIFEVADYGVAMDMFEILPVLIERLKARRASAASV
jgi:electron transfer flavoprotein alpha subunit